MQQLEQEYSGHAEGESDLKRMCPPGESCRNLLTAKNRFIDLNKRLNLADTIELITVSEVLEGAACRLGLMDFHNSFIPYVLEVNESIF